MELVWPNKGNRLLATPEGYEWATPGDPLLSPARLLYVDSYGEQSNNLLIRGDCLCALRSLAEPTSEHSRRAQVKLIYIDPPFNTGTSLGDYEDSFDSAVWLSMLQESLELSKQLLHPDGSIWVHLDDHEQHRARLVLDEVFGEDAFIATIIWDNFYKLHERAVISPSHNYIHVYAPSKKDGWAKVRNLLPEDTESGPLPLTVWYSNDTGHFQEAKEEATRLFAGDTVFTTPKPERLLQRIIQIATNPDDTVLDYFAGSGTTAAVAHKMGRRWVTVERSDSTIAKYTRPRLERVIDGEPGGISGPIHWTGGGGFKYLVST